MATYQLSGQSSGHTRNLLMVIFILFFEDLKETTEVGPVPRGVLFCPRRGYLFHFIHSRKLALIFFSNLWSQVGEENDTFYTNPICG